MPGRVFSGDELEGARRAWEVVVAAHQRQWEAGLGRQLRQDELEALGDVGDTAWSFYTGAGGPL